MIQALSSFYTTIIIYAWFGPGLELGFGLGLGLGLGLLEGDAHHEYVV